MGKFYLWYISKSKTWFIKLKPFLFIFIFILDRTWRKIIKLTEFTNCTFLQLCSKYLPTYYYDFLWIWKLQLVWLIKLHHFLYLAIFLFDIVYGIPIFKIKKKKLLCKSLSKMLLWTFLARNKNLGTQRN